MKKQPPSIFNDVIGPVMRGPSSSHTAASVRIGKLVRQFFTAEIKSFKVEFAPEGSLASTYSTQGSDIGLAGGLLDMDTDDPGLAGSLEAAKKRDINISFKIVDYQASHPNTYRIQAKGESGEENHFIFVSTGGGMFELQKINGLPVSICGDFYESLLFFKNTEQALLDQYCKKIEMLINDHDYCLIAAGGNASLINLKTGYPISDLQLRLAEIGVKLERVVQLEPVLPIRSSRNCQVPYTCAIDILQEAETDRGQLWEMALKYEAARGNISESKVFDMSKSLTAIMKASIKEGLAGSDYSDRILGPQAYKIASYSGNLSGGERDKKVIAYITAIMETKSAMGVIVAAPTAGSCGCLPGTLFAVAEELQFNDEAVSKALLAAGLVGVLVAWRSTFAAEECGCQAECGVGSGMAAAGLVQMLGGTVKQTLDASAMALQNVIGMVCDPVGGRVEVPCLGKNIMSGFNAIAAANMVLAGYENVIPLDETIGAMHQAGTMIPPELRCTGKAGLSTTATAQKIEGILKQKKL